MRRREDLPESLRPFYFDFHWSQKKLWALNLRAEQRLISDFIWLLEHPIWASSPPEKLYDLSPRQVLDQPEIHRGHYQRILNADPSFPIHAMFWRERWVIMDGFHRLLNLILKNEKHVWVYRVPVDSIANIQPDPDQPSGFLRHELAVREKKQK